MPFKKSVVREYVETILVAVVLALFFRTFVVQAFKIPSESMVPNLLIGDQLLVNKFVFAPTVSSAERAILPVRDVRRGEVVVFKFPEDPERDFIKRVVGLPGETIEFKDRRIFVNGRPVEDPHAHYLPRAGAGGSFEIAPGDVRDHYGPVVVPADALFVMGDNRNGSKDSRNPYVGCIPYSKVVGRVIAVVWPFSTFRTFERVNYS